MDNSSVEIHTKQTLRNIAENEADLPTAETPING